MNENVQSSFFFFLFFFFFFFFSFFPFFLKIQYNKYNTIIEHVSTPVPTVDNIRIQICMYMLCIHNRQKGTSIQTSIQRVGQSTSQTDICLAQTVIDCHIYVSGGSGSKIHKWIGFNRISDFSIATLPRGVIVLSDQILNSF